MVSCQKGPTRNAYAWQVGPFWQDTLDISQTKSATLVDNTLRITATDTVRGNPDPV